MRVHFSLVGRRPAHACHLRRANCAFSNVTTSMERVHEPLWRPGIFPALIAFSVPKRWARFLGWGS
jgi:hypothetical protein